MGGDRLTRVSLIITVGFEGAELVGAQTADDGHGDKEGIATTDSGREDDSAPNDSGEEFSSPHVCRSKVNESPSDGTLPEVFGNRSTGLFSSISY